MGGVLLLFGTMSTSSIIKGNSFLTAYLEANKKLIQTLVIKSDISAFLLNESIKDKYGETAVDIYEPETWKYYLNLAGKPHFTDVYMNVISLDTLEVIEFTPENLKAHTATALAYRFGTRYFYSLLRKYPQQEAYIMGVLNPVDIYDAVSAENGTVLTYDKSLVEEQELSLIEDLETYIKGYFSRWTVQGYQTTDPYYSVGLHFVLAVHSYNRLLNLRQARCHTNEVHSFHIREYLASHGGLDRYMPYLTLYQQLYLYRNIRYLEHHNGSVQQFKELTQNLLTIRNIPLAEYSISQISEFDDEKYIQTLAKKKSLGTSNNATTKEYFQLGYVQDKIRPIVYGNPVYLDATAASEEKRFRVSNSSVVQTKALESTMIDYTEAVPDPLLEILVRQWAHMSHNDLYPVLIHFTDPMTGEYRNLSSQDAFIYFNYLTLGSMGIHVDRIPKYTNVKFRRHPRPEVGELLQLIPVGMEDLVPVAYGIIQSQPKLIEVRSVSGFYDLCKKLYDESLRHWYLVSSTHDMERAAIIKQMVLKLYGYEWIDLSQGEPMVEWLKERKLPDYEAGSMVAQDVISTLFKSSTGYDVQSTGQLKYIQKNLLQLFGQLSSYSIQFLSEVNESAIIPLNWSAIRLGNIREIGHERIETYNGVDVIDLKSKTGTSIAIKNAIESTVYATTQSVLESITVEHGVYVLNSAAIEEEQPVFIDAVRYHASYPEYDPMVSNHATYIGAEFFQALTEEQRKQIKSF